MSTTRHRHETIRSACCPPPPDRDLLRKKQTGRSLVFRQRQTYSQAPEGAFPDHHCCTIAISASGRTATNTVQLISTAEVALIEILQAHFVACMSPTQPSGLGHGTHEIHHEVVPWITPASNCCDCVAKLRGGMKQFQTAVAS